MRSKPDLHRDEIAFEPRLLRPAQPPAAAWAFFVLPRDMSARLPTRSEVAVQGRLAGQPFQVTLEPDAAGGHWMKIEPQLMAQAGVSIGDTVAVSMSVMAQQPEPELPADWRAALAEDQAARATWDDISAVARRDWIQWMTSGKKGRDAREADRHRLRHAGHRQASRLLLRSIGHLQRYIQCSGSGRMNDADSSRLGKRTLVGRRIIRAAAGTQPATGLSAV